MNIRERGEGTLVQEGAQVTSTPFADYFYFRRNAQIVSVRVPKKGPHDEKIEINNRYLSKKDLSDA